MAVIDKAQTVPSHMDEIVADIRRAHPPGKRIAFLNGDFNIVHPGHLRLFNFAAECADVLVVGVNTEGLGNSYLEESLRLNGVKSISVIDHAFILTVPPAEFIARLQPDIVIKGKEFADLQNPEQQAVDAYGGTLLFSSGDMRFSSLDLLRRELFSIDRPPIVRPWDYLRRHGIDIANLQRIVGQIRDLNVVVVGDLIIDHYVTCDPVGMSQEDPTIVVTPLAEDTFVGGAGIVAAHCAGLGAKTHFLSVCGADEPAKFAREKLEDYGVQFELFTDDTRPTSYKRRYRASGKTLLRVNTLRQHDISRALIRKFLDRIEPMIASADLLIFSDFNYGVLPQTLVNALTRMGRERGVFMVADSQASSQTSDISRFKGMNLITPTEREALLACQDSSSGLAALAIKLQEQARADHLFMTLGSEGMLIQTHPQEPHELTTDRLPAFNSMPVNVSGAGDSLLTCAALSMTLGASIWEAAFIGNIAAACQVARLGNVPLTPDALLRELHP